MPADEPTVPGATPLRQADRQSHFRPPGAERPDLEQAISVLRARIDEEFRISERLDAKSRQSFLVAAGVFVVAQSVAFSLLRDADSDAAQRIFVGIAAASTIVAFLVTAFRYFTSEDLSNEQDIAPDVVVAWCMEADSSDYVATRLVRELSEVANARDARNRRRTVLHKRLSVATRTTFIFASVELLVVVMVSLT